MPEDVTAASADVKPVVKEPPADTGKAPDGQKSAEGAKPNGEAKQPPKTVVEGADDPDVKVPQNWPDNWRELMAGDDKEALKQLARYQAPPGLWKKVRNLEKVVSSSAPKKPGDDATPEEITEWRGKVGLAETPEKLLEAVKLPDGRVIGDDDKPIVDSFVKTVWQDSTPAQVSKALGWYYDHLEERKAAELEADEAYHVENRKALKEEWGPGEYKRNIEGHLKGFFADAPDGLWDRVFSARDAVGRKLGDNPDLVKFLVAKAAELNPQATITSGGEGGGSIASRRAEIRKMMLDNPSEYYKPEIQREELALIDAELKQKGRATRAA